MHVACTRGHGLFVMLLLQLQLTPFLPTFHDVSIASSHIAGLDASTLVPPFTTVINWTAIAIR